MAMAIEDYAYIGDLHTGALVGRDGSIDWLCLPRFDSGACFAALLGTPQHGRWLLAPAGTYRSTRSYREGTLVLETVFETDSGAVRVIDCMPIRDEVPDLVRRVEGLRGSVEMVCELALRFDYGSIVPWSRPGDGSDSARTQRRIRVIAGPDSAIVESDVDLECDDDDTIRARFRIGAGDTADFRICWTGPRATTPKMGSVGDSIGRTDRWWRAWSDRCTYDGPDRDAVLRSLITLKALTYAPSGGIVAAPTTSLPEHLGGIRNWDYRYCWLRDATYTLEVLLAGGYTDEAKRWREWLVRALAGRPEQMQIMYGLDGERRLTEVELPWLPGYQGAAPVRVGNDASTQLQLDVFGELMDALYQARLAGIGPAPESWSVEVALMDFLESKWREPDEGIWEVRGPRRHFTHSKVMAWAAMDRAVRTVERFGLDGPVDHWRRTRDDIRAQVLDKGWHAGQGTFTQSYGSTELDASLLLIAPVGFLPANDPRVLGTVAAIERELCPDGFVLRYSTGSSKVDGLSGGEGAFLACTFWLADNYAMQGRVGAARALFGRLLSLRNDVGLLAEEYDVAAKRQVGNFPQALSHIQLVHTAMVLAPPTDRVVSTDTMATSPAVGIDTGPRIP